ncbi:MAG: cytochrome C oxidase subunit IV family protein [Planctomycetia bacterium]|nr:cytochrome C oxidase subunit IV family protein [Planctomycetia bacterium]
MSDHGHSAHDHTSPSVAHGAGHDAHDDHGGIAKYIQVFVILCVLTGASFFTYSDYWPFHAYPSVGWAFMMAVSCTKALLVMLFFMHLKWEADWKYVLTIPASVMSVFLVLALVPDIGRRVNGFYPYSNERLEYVATPHDVDELVQASIKAQKALHPESGHSAAPAHAGGH